jgi:hypothetical protein
MVKSTKKAPGSKPKIAARPTRNKKAAQGEADGPDERRPETKADEIYGDTKILPSHRKLAREFSDASTHHTFVYLANSLFSFAVRLLASKGARTFASLSK